MSDILEITDEPVVDSPPALLIEADGNKPPATAGGTDTAAAYKLDWVDIDIDLGKGRKVTLRRPTAAEILARDAELTTEIPIGKDGGYALPDPTVNEEIDAKYFDLVKVGETDFELWEQQKAALFNRLYQREIYVDEEYVVGDDPIAVVEEIGSGNEPDFVVTHLMRMPTESEIKMYRRKSASGELKPGKRGRQKFVTSSNLKTAMSFYSQWLTGIEGATIEGKDTEFFAREALPVLAAHVDPLIQRQVVNAVVEALTTKLSD